MRLPLRDGWVDLGDGGVHRAAEVRLGDAERRLLVAVTARPGEVVGREALRVATDTPSANALDRLVARTRVKIEVDPKAPAHLITAYGEGYRWAGPDAVAAAAPAALIGRRDVARALRERIGRARVVAVVGPGGVGKTSLVRAVFPDAPFADLTAAHDADDVVRLVGAALGDPRADAAWVAARLRASVGPVILDNAEHLPDTVAGRIERWLAVCPDVRFVVTSRVPLGVPGAAVVTVEPLDADDAAALYLARARRLGVPIADGPAVRRLVAALDGLPLALELAAARADVWPPEELAPRTAQGGLDAVATPYHDVPERQASLDRTIAWSWDLLDGDDPHALASLSVFPGAFPIDVALAVLPGRAPLDVVHRLVQHGLVTVERAAGRLRLFEGVRRFAAERWAADPEAPAARARLLGWAADVGFADGLTHAVVAVILAAPGHPGASALAVRWLEGPLTSRQRLALSERALADAGLSADEQVSTLAHRSRALRYLGRDDAAMEAAIAAVHVAEATRSPHLGHALVELAHAERQLGLYDAAEAHLRRVWDGAGSGVVAHGLAGLYRYWGRRDDALAWYELAAVTYDAEGRRDLADGCRVAALDARGGEASLVAVDTIYGAMEARGAAATRLAFARAYRGLMRGRRGDLAGAASDLAFAAATLRAFDHDVPWVEVQGYRAWTAALFGDAASARACLDEAAPGLTGHLAGLLALWRALVGARLGDPDAPAWIPRAREALRPVSGSQYDGWIAVAEALVAGDARAIATRARADAAGVGPVVPFGLGE